MEAFGPDMQTIIAVLLNPTLFESGGRVSYFYVVMRILEIADEEPELVDFYFPQLLQVDFFCRLTQIVCQTTFRI